MRFFSTVALSALVSVAIAQSSRLAFTSTPATVSVGKSVTIRYTASQSDDPVTITLRKGDPGNLGTIGILTTTATGGAYTWTPSSSLSDDDDYALQITQGNENNYSGQFSLEGSDAKAVSSASASSSSVSASASKSGHATVLPIIGGATASHNSTSSHIMTSTGAVGTGAVGTGAVGTGAYAGHRNTTMSSATLSGSRSSSAGSTATTTDASNSDAAGFQGSSTRSASASATSNAASGITGSSPFALILCAVAAMLY